MDKIQQLIAEMRINPKNVRFTDLCKVCEACFGKPRVRGSSHRVYKTPWQGDPRVNIQYGKVLPGSREPLNNLNSLQREYETTLCKAQSADNGRSPYQELQRRRRWFQAAPCGAYRPFQT